MLLITYVRTNGQRPIKAKGDGTAFLFGLHKLKVSEEQRKLAIDGYEPLVAFTLSCKMYSRFAHAIVAYFLSTRTSAT
ncbi:hypothetical protein RIF29_28375 [Crotalaria pallida]|uniref:Uncharacterized protein n=1 Tax=Crotalaria pallida TaxID=3830 RepID=A0AAN9ERA1_CROPI